MHVKMPIAVTVATAVLLGSSTCGAGGNGDGGGTPKKVGGTAGTCSPLGAKTVTLGIHYKCLYGDDRKLHWTAQD